MPIKATYMKSKILNVSLIFCLLFFATKNVTAQSKTAGEKPAKPVKPPPDKLLNAKVFVVVLEQPHGKKKPKLIDDEISFKSTKLNSKFFKEEHFFVPGFYTATVDTSYEEPEEPEEAEEADEAETEDADAPEKPEAPAKPVTPATPGAKPSPKQIISVLFESQQTNDIKEEIRWAGQVIGDSITGSAFYKEKKHNTEVEYIFNGHLKPKPGKKPVPAK
jgi:hypothetical protein